jgi:hypothetical protein
MKYFGVLFLAAVLGLSPFLVKKKKQNPLTTPITPTIIIITTINKTPIYRRGILASMRLTSSPLIKHCPIPQKTVNPFGFSLKRSGAVSAKA